MAEAFMMMRKAAKLILPLTILTVVGIWLFGCGSSDLLDENNQRYGTRIYFTDGEQDEVMTIDVLRNECDGNITIISNGGTDCDITDDVLKYDDLEDFTDVLANITITVDRDAPGLTLTGYTIDYFGEASADGTGAIVMPPDLSDLGDEGTYNISIPSGSSTTFTLTCMTVDTKEEFNLRNATTFTPQCGADEDGDGFADFWIPAWTYGATIATARYTIRFTLHFTDEYLQDRELTIERTIYLGNYDRC